MSGIKITKALYGTGSTTVDVAKTIMTHMRDGSINLVISPDSLNVKDPAPGEQKTLDITYVINNGNTMSQLVKDNEVLMISAPPERRATGLQITKAEYGYPGNFTDVTDAVQNYVKNGSINIKVGYETVGLPDPNPNKQKTLDVEYEINGSRNTIQLQDGKMLNISAPPGDTVDNTTPSSYVTQFVGILFTNLYRFALTFLYTVSIFATADFFDAVPVFTAGPTTSQTFATQALQSVTTVEGGKRLGFLVIGAIFPGIAYWGLPIYVFWRRIFSDSYTI